MLGSSSLLRVDAVTELLDFSFFLSGAGGAMSGTLGSGAGSDGVGTGGAVARFKIWAI